MNYTVSDALPEQLCELEALEKQCFSLPWSLSALENQLLSDNCRFLTAVSDDGTVLGYIGLSCVLDEGYISNVAVSPKFRRLGIGDALIEALISKNEKALSLLNLEVRENNSPAIALYAKHGFEPVGLRKNYYNKPKENAVLMTLFFNSEENQKC